MYLRLFIMLFCFIFIIGCSKPVEIPVIVVNPVKDEQVDVSIEPKENIWEEKNCIVFDDFTGSQKNNWVIVNDGVMWGLSKWTYTVNNSILTLAGNINTNGGWFSSIHTALSESLLETTTHIHISVKPDTRDYKITFRDNNRRGISHQADLVFKNTGWFENIVIPLSDLKPTYFGRSSNAADFQKNQARELGFIISDGIDGPFQLEIESIKFCKE